MASNPFALPHPFTQAQRTPTWLDDMPAPASAPTAAATPFAEPPASAPAPPAPRPPMLGLQPPTPARPQGPSFIGGALPLLAAIIAGGKQPAAIGAGLAAYLQGKRLREADLMDARELALKHQAEAAEFYGRALAQAQTIGDPITFEQWKTAIGPVAQLHGIDPNIFTFNNQKLAAKTKQEAADLLEALDKQHPDGNYTAEWKGKRITRADLAQVAGLGAFNAQGQPLAPTKIAAPRQEPAVGSFEDYVRRTYGESPTPAQIVQARKDYGSGSGAGVNAGSFEDYVARYAKARNRTVEQLTDKDLEDARKRFSQADDRPPSIVPVVIQTAEGPQLLNRATGTTSAITSAAGQPVKQALSAMERMDARKFDKAGPVLASIAELSEKINTQQGLIAKMSGGAARVAAQANYNDDVAEYQALISGFTPLVARSLGHTGVLTQQDVDSVRELFPKPGDSKTLRDRKIARITSIIGQLQTTEHGQGGPPRVGAKSDPLGIR